MVSQKLKQGGFWNFDFGMSFGTSLKNQIFKFSALTLSFSNN